MTRLSFRKIRIAYGWSALLFTLVFWCYCIADDWSFVQRYGWSPYVGIWFLYYAMYLAVFTFYFALAALLLRLLLRFFRRKGSALPVLAGVLLVWSCTGCTGNEHGKGERRIDFPEPDRDLRLRYEAERKAAACGFADPDTSLSGILLRDPESTDSVLPGVDLPGDSTHYFRSRDGRQVLALTVHPGDGRGSVNIFRVQYPNAALPAMKPTSLDDFVTEKGIRLGLRKEEVVARLGTCYGVADSGAHFIELVYRIHAPADSRTGLLQRQNMPVYYGTYSFRRNQLEAFEFGFEYP